MEQRSRNPPSRKILRSILVDAIQCIDPIRGVTLTDLIKYAKNKVDWSTGTLRNRIPQILKSGIQDLEILKVGKNRYCLKTSSMDETTGLCGSCGGMKKKRRKACKKKRRKSKCKKRRRRRRKSCKKRSRKSKCKRKKKKKKCKRKRRKSNKSLSSILKKCLKKCGKKCGRRRSGLQENNASVEDKDKKLNC